MTRFTSLLLLLVGCVEVDPPVTDLECGNLDLVDGTVDVGPTVEPVDDALTVRGTAVHPSNLAIRDVRVAGVRAANDGFNFSSWSATVPWATLAELADDDAEATVEVTALDACDIETTFASFRVPIDLRPDITVEDFTITLDYPQDADVVPADGSAAAVLTLEANPEATGAEIGVSATFGRFAGSGARDVVLVFGGNGIANATASAVFYADRAGTAVFAATSEDVTRTASLRAVDDPVLSPSSATIVAGGSLTAAVLTEAPVDRCSATPAEGVSMTSGGVDITQAPVALDSDGDGVPDVRITVDPDLAAPALVTVTCADVFGQEGVGQFVAAVP